MLIQLFGIPGSGKSYLCSKLEKKGVKCVGTDDLFTAALRELKGKKSSKNFQTARQRQRLVEQAKRNAKRNFLRGDQDLVLEGITLGVVPGATKLFMSLSASELQDSYRRLWAREIEKLCRHKTRILGIVQGEPNVRRIATEIQIATNQAVDLPITFEQYQNMYRGALRFERGRGSLIVPKAKVVNKILALRRQK